MDRVSDKFSDIDLAEVLGASFAEGKGVLQLSARMSDETMLLLIKQACGWSKGQAFVVIPPM
jgi:hypothetical protein